MVSLDHIYFALLLCVGETMLPLKLPRKRWVCPGYNATETFLASLPKLTTLYIPVPPECWDDLCVHRGRSVSWLKHEAGNHQSSMSPVPWEGILGNEKDKLACDGMCGIATEWLLLNFCWLNNEQFRLFLIMLKTDITYRYFVDKIKQSQHINNEQFY